VIFAVAASFLACEWWRLQREDRPLLRASVEAFRMAGMVAVAILFIELAVDTDATIRACFGALSVIAGALIFNNAYLALHRRYLKNDQA
jgi:hypothetical protein